LQGLVVEAERRGHSVEVPADEVGATRAHDLRWSGQHHGHLVITVDDCSTAVRVSEEGLQGRAYWPRNDEWSPFDPGDGNRRRPGLREYEAGATGCLRFSIVPPYASHGRQVNWADRKSWTVQDKLPELLRELEVRAAEERYRREQAALEAAVRERARQAAIEVALERYVEQLRAEALSDQVTKWRLVSDIRAYCDAAEAAFGGDAAAADWITWAGAYADHLDPLREPPRPPDLPDKVRGDELRPFLRGYEPDLITPCSAAAGETG
jgi:hypothetical protein